MRAIILALVLSTVSSLAPSFIPQAATATTTRKGFLQTAFLGVAASTFFPAIVFAEDETVTLPSGVSYVINKKGDGPVPEIGELGAIRFRAFAGLGGNKIDDIFDTPEPYYTRIGSGGMLKVGNTKSTLTRAHLRHQ